VSFSVGKKNNSKKRHIISDINITPFVDVLLVLLIIFMVAAPMMTSSVNLELPKGSTTPMNQKVQPITISVQEDGRVFLQDEAVKLGLIPAQLLAITNNNLSSKILVRADKKLDYGRVMEVVKTISLAGFDQIVLVTEVAND
jgi:biopolymer transport protein TolR